MVHIEAFSPTIGRNGRTNHEILNRVGNSVRPQSRLVKRATLSKGERTMETEQVVKSSQLGPCTCP